MKLLIVSCNYYEEAFGGAELQMKYLMDYFVSNRADVEIHYIYIKQTNKIIVNNNVVLHPIERIKFAERIFDYLSYYFTVKSLIQKIQPNLIYHRIPSAFALSALKYAIKNESTQFVLHISSQEDVDNSVKSSFRKNILRYSINNYAKLRLLKKANKVVVQADYQSELLQKNYGRRADLIMHNGHPLPDEKIDKSKRIQIIWVANLKEMKQPEIFIDLAKKTINNNVDFIVVGRDPKNAWSFELIATMKIMTNLRYFGELSISEVNSLLSKSHIFVNTSTYEGFPNTFIQAWMRRVPVVSLNVDPDDVIKNNKLGFHSLTFEQMLLDVNLLIESPDILNQYADNAYKFGIRNYSINNFKKIASLMDV